MPLIGELVPRNWERWSQPSPEGSSPSSPNWPAQQPPTYTSRALSWCTPASTPSITCWSAWKYWPAEPWPLGLHDWGDSRMSGEFRGVPMLMVCWRPDALNLTNSTLQWTCARKAVWTKEDTEWHQAAPSATKTTEEAMEGQRRRSKAFCFVFSLDLLVCLFLFC